MKQARELENRATHPNTNSEDYAPFATNGKMSEFRFVTECSYDMSNTLDQIPVDKTWSPTESSRKIKPEVQ